MSSHTAPRRRRRRAQPRVHRHLFDAPAHGLLLGAWGFGGHGKTADRYEEEA